MKTVPKAEATTKGRRTIFDGVLLPRFYPPVKEKEKEKETETEKETEKEKADAVVSDGAASDEKGEEVEADNEEKGEEGVDHVLEGLEDSKVESSLASSNKGLPSSLLSKVFFSYLCRKRRYISRPGL